MDQRDPQMVETSTINSRKVAKINMKSINIREQAIRKYRAAVLKDLRRQIKLITDVIVIDDQHWLDIYADQLSASAINLKEEVMLESLGLDKESK